MATFISASKVILDADHAFDDRTAYCTRCGCHWNAAYQMRRACIDAPNVIAISHLRARARLDALMELRRAPVPPQGA